MSNQSPTSRIDHRSTVFDDGTEFEINHNYANNIISPEALDKKRHEEALLRAAKIAAGSGLAEEAVRGVNVAAADTERNTISLNPEVIANITRQVGEYMQAVREQEIKPVEAHKKSDFDLAA